MSVRFALGCVFAIGLISSAFAMEASGPLSTKQNAPLIAQGLNGVRIGQADTSKKCDAGFYWTCSKSGCWCQRKGQVY
jgi:hypothetical protein